MLRPLQPFRVVDRLVWPVEQLSASAKKRRRDILKSNVRCEICRADAAPYCDARIVLKRILGEGFSDQCGAGPNGLAPGEVGTTEERKDIADIS